MFAEAQKREMAKNLQAKINAMQGLGKPSGEPSRAGLSLFASAFPGQAFPTSALHEFISYESVESASTNGFITALMGKFMKEGGICLWIGNRTKIFPQGLKHFGMDPDRIVFIDAQKPKDALWIIEESLKCEALTAVVGEIRELGFTDSRRLQLAVEHSGVTCFVHRFRPHTENATACTARWKIIPLPSSAGDGLPGIGNSHWEVQLLKVRNGKPKSWQVVWSGNNFLSPDSKYISIAPQDRHAV
jgi:protein ImuA